MANGQASVVIPHSVGAVWEYITDPKNAPTVLPGLSAARADKDPPFCVGDQWHGTARLFGISYEWTGEFTRIEPNRLMEFRSVESRFPFVTVDSLIEVSDGTLYTCDAKGEPMIGGRAGSLLDRVMSTIYQRLLSRHLQRLPAHIDSWAAEQR